MNKLILLICIAISTSVFADRIYDPNKEKEYNVGKQKKWVETSTKLNLTTPLKQNLAPIDIGSIKSNFQYFIDKTTIGLTDDGVSHYTTVIKSGNTNNIFVTSLRCSKDEIKIIAQGINSKLIKIDNPTWKPLGHSPRYSQIIAKSIICSDYSRPNPVNVILSKLK